MYIFTYTSSVLFIYIICFPQFIHLTFAGKILMEMFLADSWGKLHIGLLLIVYRGGMPTRCMPLIIDVLTTLHRQIPEVMDSTIGHIRECHHRERLTLKLKTIQITAAILVMVTVTMVNNILYLLLTILTLGLILNIMKEIADHLPIIVGNTTCVMNMHQGSIRTLCQCTHMDLGHKLHVGSILVLIQVVTTTIRTINQLELLVIHGLVVGFHLPTRALPGGMYPPSNQATNIQH